jgi:hypothetical protein
VIFGVAGSDRTPCAARLRIPTQIRFDAAGNLYAGAGGFGITGDAASGATPYGNARIRDFGGYDPRRRPRSSTSRRACGWMARVRSSSSIGRTIASNSAPRPRPRRCRCRPRPARPGALYYASRGRSTGTELLAQDRGSGAIAQYLDGVVAGPSQRSRRARHQARRAA